MKNWFLLIYLSFRREIWPAIYSQGWGSVLWYLDDLPEQYLARLGAARRHLCPRYWLALLPMEGTAWLRFLVKARDWWMSAPTNQIPANGQKFRGKIMANRQNSGGDFSPRVGIAWLKCLWPSNRAAHRYCLPHRTSYLLKVQKYLPQNPQHRGQGIALPWVLAVKGDLE